MLLEPSAVKAAIGTEGKSEGQGPQAEGLRALAARFAEHRVPWDAYRFGSRVRVVLGAPYERRFGLGEAEYAQLSASVAAVYHLHQRDAAFMSLTYQVRLPSTSSPCWLYQTRRLLLQDCARDNVQSAAEIVRFALSSTPVKAVHQLSSLLVFGGRVFERNSSQDQENGPNLIRRTPENADVGVDARTAALLHLDGVTQSFFVAEKLLAAAAREHGVPLRVYRPGFVGWHSKTRAVDRDGYLARLLAQMAHSGPSLAFNVFIVSLAHLRAV